MNDIIAKFEAAVTALKVPLVVVLGALMAANQQSHFMAPEWIAYITGAIAFFSVMTFPPGKTAAVIKDAPTEVRMVEPQAEIEIVRSPAP